MKSKSMAEIDRGFLQPSIPKFDGHFDHWALLMENLLWSKDYWSVVATGIPTLATNATPENAEDVKLKDLKAKNYLFQSIERSIIETITKKDTAKEIWDAMKQRR